MRESITLDRVANSILQRSKKYENFILVEGSNDRIFFLKFKNANSQIEITFGWEKLIELLKLLKARGFKNVIGVIDKDHRSIIPLEVDLDEELIETDFHDINILTINESFEPIFNVYCSEDKYNKFLEDKKIKCLKTYTFNIAENLSYLRLLNKRENLHLSFKTNDGKKNRLDYSKFVNKDKYEFISLEKMIETITNFSRSKTTHSLLSNEKIYDLLIKLKSKESFDYLLFCNGHDFSELICLSLKKVLGSREVEPESFLKDCILNFDIFNFEKTEMYSKIKELEKIKKTQFLKT